MFKGKKGMIKTKDEEALLDPFVHCHPRARLFPTGDSSVLCLVWFQASTAEGTEAKTEQAWQNCAGKLTLSQLQAKEH